MTPEPKQRPREHIPPFSSEIESLCPLKHLNKSSQGEAGGHGRQREGGGYLKDFGEKQLPV